MSSESPAPAATAAEPVSGRARLARFIEANTTQVRFAKQIECSESHLSLILSGYRGVSMKLAKRIAEATAGAVPMDTLVGNGGEP